MFLGRTLLLIVSLWSSVVLAGPILQIENNKLVGVKDVDVGLYKYDVSFEEGSCIEVFDGCSAFPFKLLADELNPYDDLFDALKVLHKAIYGSDDTHTPPPAWEVPELKIPAKKWNGMISEEDWYISYARFFNAGSYSEYSVEFNLIDCEDLWTVWSNPRHVPEPSSLVLVLTMLLAVFGVHRNKYRTL